MIGAVVAASAWAAIAFFTSDLRVKRQLRKLRVSKIADAPDGERVKIVGTVASTATLTSPNGGKPCVYYQAWHEELQRGQQRGGKGWVQVGEEQCGCDFTLRDESGAALVAGESAIGFLADDSYTAIEGADPGTRGREGVITDGQRIAVIGIATREPVAADQATGYREGMTQVVLRGTDSQPLILSDDPAITG
jgi:hypothetical protein